ncbi:MAG TPA: hypothetical protein VGO93_21605 [Candidatus Xenobia bacterium]|jgi:hypothetical protein
MIPDLEPPWDLQLALLRRRYRIIIAALCGLNMVAILLGGGWAYARRHGLLGQREAVVAAREVVAAATAALTPPPDILEVNDKPVTLYDVDTLLALQHGSEAVHQLVVDMVILQEADKRHVTLDAPDDLVQVRRLEERVRHQSSYRIQHQHLQATLLLRKMVLQPVTDPMRRQYFKRHRDDLVRYFLLALARRSGNPRALGWWTAPQIQATFGPQAVAAAQAVAAGKTQPTRSFPSRRGPAYLRIERVLDGYTELLPAINQAMAAERSPVYIRRLLARAHITSPLMVQDQERYPRQAVAQVSNNPPVLKDVFAEPTAVPVRQGTAGILSLPPASHEAHGVFAPVPSSSGSPSPSPK